jgi:hypothetical protein
MPYRFSKAVRLLKELAPDEQKFHDEGAKEVEGEVQEQNTK